MNGWTHGSTVQSQPVVAADRTPSECDGRARQSGKNPMSLHFREKLPDAVMLAAS